MKRLTYLLLLIGTLLFVSACGGAGESETESESADTELTEPEVPVGETESSESSELPPPIITETDGKVAGDNVSAAGDNSQEEPGEEQAVPREQAAGNRAVCTRQVSVAQ